MHYIVMPVRPQGLDNIDGSRTLTDRAARACSKKYYTDKGQAMEAAKELAKNTPNVQFAVFEPAMIFEALPPPPPPPVEVKMLQKRVTETGEIILSKED